MTKSTSSVVLNRPRPKRTEPSASSSGKPRAWRTWEGESVAEAQADPDQEVAGIDPEESHRMAALATRRVPRLKEAATLAQQEEGAALARFGSVQAVEELLEIDLDEREAVHAARSGAKRACMNSKWSRRGFPFGSRMPLRCQEKRRHCRSR